jgi:hypothetical protein
LVIIVKVSGENSRAAADVYVVLGEIAARQGNSAEVRRMQRRVYRIRLKTLGPRHPTIAASRFNMAMTKWRTRGGNPLPELRVALKDIESAYGADSEEALNYALALTHPLHSQGEHVEELAIEAKAVGALEKRLARTDPGMISKWIELALSLRNHERPVVALVYFRRGTGALIERIRDSSRSPALLDEYGRKRGYFRWQVATEWAVANPE